MRLPINWQPISYRFGVIAAYCSNFGHFAFCSYLFGGIGATYDVHLGLIGKGVVDFLLVLIELFSLDVTYIWGASGENRSKIGDFAPTRSVWPKISGRRGRLSTIIFTQIVRPMNALQHCRWQFLHKLNVLSYGIKIWTDLSSVLSQFTRLTDRHTNSRTDRQTDRILIARRRLHSTQRGKNKWKNLFEFERFLWPSVADLDLGPVKFSMLSMYCGSTSNCDLCHYNTSIHSGNRRHKKTVVSIH